MKIKRFLRCALSNQESLKDTEDLLEAAGHRLDKAYPWDIVGLIVFEGEDGKIYTGNVEFVIEEAHPELVEELEAEDTGASEDKTN